jgi:hypothetical protein
VSLPFQKIYSKLAYALTCLLIACDIMVVP